MAEEKSQPFNLPLHPMYLHEDEELSQQCKDLISTLPTESGWINVQLHQYHGFWFAKRHFQGILNCASHFQAQDSDIFLITQPKSGTTWVKALSFAILNRNTNHYHANNPLLTTNPHDLVPFLDMNLYYQKAMPDLSSLPSPRLFASHLPYVLLSESVKQSGCKIVYLCRNPKDVFVSTWHFANKVRAKTQGSISSEDSSDKFCRGVVGFGPFWDDVLWYYKDSLERPQKIMFLRYEELKDEPVKTLKKLAKFMGYGFSKDEENRGNVVENILKLCGFESLSNLEVNKSGKTRFGIVNDSFFRNGEIGDWKNFVTLEMTKRIDDITEEKLGNYALKL